MKRLLTAIAISISLIPTINVQQVKADIDVCGYFSDTARQAECIVDQAKIINGQGYSQEYYDRQNAVEDEHRNRQCDYIIRQLEGEVKNPGSNSIAVHLGESGVIICGDKAAQIQELLGRAQ